MHPIGGFHVVEVPLGFVIMVLLLTRESINRCRENEESVMAVFEPWVE
jgi:hypothetical protein